MFKATKKMFIAHILDNDDEEVAAFAVEAAPFLVDGEPPFDVHDAVADAVVQWLTEEYEGPLGNGEYTIRVDDAWVIDEVKDA